MTAQAARLTYVASGPSVNGGATVAEKMGFLVRSRAAAGRAKDFILAAPKAAWNWLSQNATIAAAGGWVKARVASAAAFMGTSGLVGAGILAVSTDTGRKVLNTAFAPVRWGGRLLSKAVRGIANFAGNFGRPGRWVARQILTGHDMVAGNTNRPGLVGRVKYFYNDHIKYTARTTGPIMYTAKAVGLWLTAGPAIGLATMLPWGALAWLTGFAVRAVFTGAILWNIYAATMTTADAGLKWFGFDEGIGEDHMPTTYRDSWKKDAVPSTVVPEPAPAQGPTVVTDDQVVPGDVVVSDGTTAPDAVNEALQPMADANRAAKRAMKKAPAAEPTPAAAAATS